MSGGEPMKAPRLATIAVAVLLGACDRAERASVDNEPASAPAVNEASGCVTQHGGRETDRDVLGIYVGMPVSNAIQLLSCHNERFGFLDVPFDTGLTQAIGYLPYGRGLFGEVRAAGAHAGEGELAPGEERIFFAAVAGASDDTIVGVWREEALAADAAISMDDAVAGLIAKYGRPSREQTHRAYSGGGVLVGEYGRISGMARVEGARAFVWLYQDGALVPSTATARLQQCDEGMYIDPRQNGQMGGTCGLMIKAQVIPSLNDPTRAARIQVGIFDRAYAERALQAERQRR